MSIDSVREIVAPFLGVDPHNINNNTIIDRSAIQGSVLIHRMRAEIIKAGYQPDSWDDIRTVGDLLGLPASSEGVYSPKDEPVRSVIDYHTPVMRSSLGIGIDIEAVDSIPFSEDFASEAFILDNFSRKEISYCTRQKNPRQCFAGRFAAKEAIFKASNAQSGRDFSLIEIKQDKDGQPYTDLCNVSISHLKNGPSEISIAVAVSKSSTQTVDNLKTTQTYKEEKCTLEAPSESKKKNVLGRQAFLWLFSIAIAVYLLNRDYLGLF